MEEAGSVELLLWLLPTFYMIHDSWWMSRCIVHDAWCWKVLEVKKCPKSQKCPKVPKVPKSARPVNYNYPRNYSQFLFLNNLNESILLSIWSLHTVMKPSSIFISVTIFHFLEWCLTYTSPQVTRGKIKYNSKIELRSSNIIDIKIWNLIL